MTLKDFVMTMNIDDYMNKEKVMPNMFFNFINKYCSQSVNIIGNPEYRSDDFNVKQINSLIKDNGDYVIQDWKLTVDNNGSRIFNFTFKG